MSTPDQIITIVYTDGLGTFQARSTTSDWRGPWRRSEKKAIEDARARGEVEAQS
jgi:hypothetical protein